MYNADQILQLAASYEKSCQEGLVKKADRIRVASDDTNDAEEKVIDLTGAIDFSYSAIMREMRQNADKDQL